jgi:hypothetical protein
MAKIGLLSILIATIAIPIRYARVKNARKALKGMVTAMTVFIFAWVIFCCYVFLRIGGGD